MPPSAHGLREQGMLSKRKLGQYFCKQGGGCWVRKKNGRCPLQCVIKSGPELLRALIFKDNLKAVHTAHIIGERTALISSRLK